MILNVQYFVKMNSYNIKEVSLFFFKVMANLWKCLVNEYNLWLILDPGKKKILLSGNNYEVLLISLLEGLGVIFRGILQQKVP